MAVKKMSFHNFEHLSLGRRTVGADRKLSHLASGEMSQQRLPNPQARHGPGLYGWLSVISAAVSELAQIAVGANRRDSSLQNKQATGRTGHPGTRATQRQLGWFEF